MKRTRIMYIEQKAGALTGPAWIGRVRFSKTGKMLYYRDQKFQSLKGTGFKSNYYDVKSGDDYWISGPRKDGADRLYGERVPIKIDEEVREQQFPRLAPRRLLASGGSNPRFHSCIRHLSTTPCPLAAFHALPPSDTTLIPASPFTMPPTKSRTRPNFCASECAGHALIATRSAWRRIAERRRSP